MTNILDVLETGSLVVCRPSICITASEDTLTCWTTTDIDATDWKPVHKRAGGAALFPDAISLHKSADAWLGELLRTGRM